MKVIFDWLKKATTRKAASEPAADDGKRPRVLSGLLAHIFRATAALFSLFYIYTAGFGVISTETHRGLYVMFTFILCFMLFPAARKSSRTRVTVVDAALILLTMASLAYWMLMYKDHMFNIGEMSVLDMIFGISTMLLSFEVVRRVLGWPLVIVGAFFVLQLFLGPYLPGYLSNRGFGLARVVEYMYSGVFAIFGSITDVFATYILPFLIFGGFLEVSGAGDFFIKMTTAMVGQARGGPAKVAVLGSALMGSISGSSVANVVATGTFTIPMMKRIGYPPHVAGAIEAAASTGGQFMPPIMGAGAFILASMTEIPYTTVMWHATIPAIFYFLYVGTAVHLEAITLGMKGLPKEQLPSLGKTLVEGWPFIPPFVVLVSMLLIGYSPFLAAFWSIISIVALTSLQKKTRMSLGKIYEGLVSGARSSLVVGATVGVLGMIMGGISMAGLGLQMSAMILYLAKGSLLATVLLTIVAGNILGMGLPTAASYVVMAIMAAPALIQLGVPVLVAHLFCFWMSLTSNITPPVCVCGIAAAGIAGADSMKTGFAALKYAAILYIMPLTFIYSPAILAINSTPVQVIEVVVSALFGLVCLAAGLQGYLASHLNWPERIALLAAAVMTFVPGVISSATGIAILAVVYVLSRRRGKAVATAGAPR